MSEPSRRFRPRRRASRGQRATLLFLVGPALWLVALVLVGAVARRSDAVAIGLLIAATSFGLALVVLVAMRFHRVREEGEQLEPGR